MPFDWREFLVIAHELRNDTREGVQRTSLGRGYYYVYNLGLVKAKTQRYRMIKGAGGLHQQLWNWYQSHTNPVMRQMGIDANRMYSLRPSSDYKDAPIPNIALEVKTQITRARAFESSMAQLNGQPPPAALAL